MAKRRSKTKAEKAEEWQEKKRKAYEEFRPILESLQSYAQAELVWQSAPSLINPGQSYYANLGFFLQNLAAPERASRDELALYLALARKMDAAGELKGASLQEIEERLRVAMESRTEK